MSPSRIAAFEGTRWIAKKITKPITSTPTARCRVHSGGTQSCGFLPGCICSFAKPTTISAKPMSETMPKIAL